MNRSNSFAAVALLSLGRMEQEAAPSEAAAPLRDQA